MEPISSIITPEVGCESFEVDGVVYHRTEVLCLGRARLLQRFQTELQYDMSIPAVQQAMVGIAADLNGNKLLDGLKKFGNLMDGLDVLGQNRFRQAEVVALFYDADAHSPADYSYELVKTKVAAWGAVSSEFFIRAAFGLLVDFWNRSLPALDQSASAPPPVG
ncbi:MAG: hypothetical protein ACRYFZ_09530 [Janthinobacterium lividum]